MSVCLFVCLFVGWLVGLVWFGLVWFVFFVVLFCCCFVVVIACLPSLFWLLLKGIDTDYEQDVNAGYDRHSLVKIIS